MLFDDDDFILPYIYRTGSGVISARLTGEDDSDYLTCYQWYDYDLSMPVQSHT